MQRLYMAILNPVYDKFISQIDNKLRMAYVRFVFVGFWIYFILFFSKALKKHILFSHSQRELFAIVLLLAAAIFSMEGPLHPVKWKRRITIPLVLGGMGLIVTGLMHPIGDGYWTFGIMLLLVYPCFYFVWNNRKDYETLFDIVAGTHVNVGVFYFVYSAALFNDEMLPDGDRFQATISDPNLYGLVGMAMFCCAAYMIYRKNGNKRAVIYYAVAASMGMFEVILGQSRSAMAVCVGAAVTVVWYTIKLKNTCNGERYKKIIMMTLVVSLCLIGGSALLSISVVSSGTEQTGFLARFIPQGGLDSFTSGRVTLWHNYAEQLNMTGNNFDEVDWYELTVFGVKHAHNNFLEYGYRCGIPVAVLFTLLEFFAGLLSLKYLFSRRWTKDYYVFTVICMVMYTVMSLIDIATIPMERCAPFLFYIAVCVFIDGEEAPEELQG